jgi:hypothetical protein
MIQDISWKSNLPELEKLIAEDPNRAIKLLSIAIESDPRSSTAYFMLGKAQANAATDEGYSSHIVSGLDEAIKSLETARTFNPKGIEILRELCRIYVIKYVVGMDAGMPKKTQDEYLSRAQTYCKELSCTGAKGKK